MQIERVRYYYTVYIIIYNDGVITTCLNDSVRVCMYARTRLINNIISQ